MQLDPSIILQAGRGVVPIKTQDEIADEQANRQMRQLQLQGAQQQFADDQAYRDVLRSGATGTDLVGKLQAAGLGKQAQQAQQLQSEQQKNGLERAKAISEALKYGANAVMANPSEQSALGMLDEISQRYGIPATTFDAGKARILAARNDPNAIRQLMMGLGGKAEEALGKFQTVDMGGSQVTQRVNPLTGQIEVAGEQSKTATPGALMADQTARRGQDMTDARAREFNAAKQEENAINRAGKTAETSTALRKEFEGLPEVKNYKQALPSFKGIEDAVTRNTPMSDINIVYGIAKLYDPNSVVREGEYATVANSPAIPERIKGYAQYLAGGGKLTAEVKRQILTEAQSRMKTFEDEYQKARTNYEDIAARSGGDKSLVINQKFEPALKGPKPKTKPLNIGGKDMMAELAPDGNYYVQQGGKWFKVKE